MRNETGGSARRALFGLALAIIGVAYAESNAFARSPCDFLAGDARRQCVKAEVAAQTVANRTAADAARQGRSAANGQSRVAMPTYLRAPTPATPNRDYADVPPTSPRASSSGLPSGTLMTARIAPDPGPKAQANMARVHQAVPLWAPGHGGAVLPGSLSIAATTVPDRWTGSYRYHAADGSAATRNIVIQMIGTSVCVNDARNIAQYCDDIPGLPDLSPRVELQDYREAKALCDRGDPHGCNNQGQMLWEGDGVSQDRRRAAPIFKMACDRGVSSGCYNLAQAYTMERGIGKDPAKAAQYLARACKGGSSAACSQIEMNRPRSRTLVAECVVGGVHGYSTMVDTAGDETGNHGPYDRVGTKYQNIIENNCDFTITFDMMGGGGRTSERLSSGQTYTLPKDTSWSNPQRAR